MPEATSGVSPDPLTIAASSGQDASSAIPRDDIRVDRLDVQISERHLEAKAARTESESEPRLDSQLKPDIGGGSGTGKNDFQHNPPKADSRTMGLMLAGILREEKTRSTLFFGLLLGVLVDGVFIVLWFALTLIIQHTLEIVKDLGSLTGFSARVADGIAVSLDGASALLVAVFIVVDLACSIQEIVNARQGHDGS